MCMGEVNFFSLKVIVLFLGCVFFVVFQRVCVSRYSLHMSVLCVCMRDVISEFNFEIQGSLAFCALMLFLCYILLSYVSGSSLYVEGILPFVMLCLSAWRIMFVMIVFAVCVYLVLFECQRKQPRCL